MKPLCKKHVNSAGLSFVGVHFHLVFRNQFKSKYEKSDYQ
jgi:hypothetical protein